MINTVLFDFDGTLVHTAPGILNGFRRVLADAGITPAEPVDERVIGPPLLATLTRLSGVEAPRELDHLAAAFKAWYDTEGVFQAESYPGLDEMLDMLRAADRRAFVVTNKRIVAARAIATRLGFMDRLVELYALDSLTPPAPRKLALVAHVLAAHEIDPASAVLVGDSAEDAEAATGNDLRFIAATFGYGAPIGVAGAPAVGALQSLGELPGLLLRLA